MALFSLKPIYEADLYPHSPLCSGGYMVSQVRFVSQVSDFRQTSRVRQEGKQTGRQAGSETDRQAVGCIKGGSQPDRWTARQMDRQRQTDR